MNPSIYLILYRQIIHGDYPPETPLKMIELADQLHVSTTPVREALIRLCADGLVELQPGKGFFPRHLSDAELLAEYELGHVLLQFVIKRLTAKARMTASWKRPLDLPEPPRPCDDIQQILALADWVGKIFDEWGGFVGNRHARHALSAFVAHTHQHRRLQMLRAPSITPIVDNLQELVQSVDAGDEQLAQAALAWHIEMETEQLRPAQSYVEPLSTQARLRPSTSW